MDIQGVELGDGENTSLEAKKVALLPYSSVREFVLNDQAILL